jgi:hypothetical protein
MTSALQANLHPLKIALLGMAPRGYVVSRRRNPVEADIRTVDLDVRG